MKKITKAALVGGVAALILTGCGNSASYQAGYEAGTTGVAPGLVGEGMTERGACQSAESFETMFDTAPDHSDFIEGCLDGLR